MSVSCFHKGWYRMGVLLCYTYIIYPVISFPEGFSYPRPTWGARTNYSVLETFNNYCYKLKKLEVFYPLQSSRISVIS